MEYGGIIILLLFCWLLQIGLTFTQQRHYTLTINKLKKESCGHLGVGIAKPKFNLGIGVVLIIITSEEGKIINYYTMKGISTLARFKRKRKYLAVSPSQIIIKNKKEKLAFNQAIDLINKERFKNNLEQISI